MDRLCYGVYLHILLKYAKGSKNKSKLARTLLSSSIIEGEYPEFRDDNDYYSPLLNCTASVTNDLIGQFKRKSIADQICDYFSKNVLPLLKDIDAPMEELRQLIIQDECVKRILSNEKTKFLRSTLPPANFLAFVFLHAITETENKDGRETVIRRFTRKAKETQQYYTISVQEITPYNSISIWNASRNDYLESRNAGSRFANLNILSNLLPHGYIITDMMGYGKTEEDDEQPLQELLEKYVDSHISLIGEGGIGKTTFLLKLMEKSYEVNYENATITPIFIELNRCPKQIGEWYWAKHQKTNFITRYIAAQSNLYDLDNVPFEVLSQIESDLKRESDIGKPKYLLLLDGLNEVNRGMAIGRNGNSIGSTIREMLMNEIKILMNYPNVRVIITSRKIDLAFFPGTVKNVELTGVKKSNIEEHLRVNHYSQYDINNITSSRKLLDCLRIPLFLCMFTANNVSSEYKPLTRGEILFGFFNKTQGIYYEKNNMERIHAPSTIDRTYVLFIIDFVLPYIGWSMEYDDCFYLNKGDFINTIQEYFSSNNESISFWNKKIIVFPEYETEIQSLNDMKEALIQLGFDAVLDCIVNTLGIMYRDKNNEYHFIHHHIRDYFAGIHEIQMLKMAAAFYDLYISTNKPDFIEDSYNALSLAYANIWSESKRMFIGEILGEHRNAPIINESGKWEVSSPIFKEQRLLRTVLDIFIHSEQPAFCCILNIVETMKNVRGNLAGVDFTNLDLRECRLHGVNCSLGRNEQKLSAVFVNTDISDYTFEVGGHTEKMYGFAYSYKGEFLFTISDDYTAKQWETETGRCVNTIKIENGRLYESDYYMQDKFVSSEDDDFFIVCGYNPDNELDGHLCFVQEYYWNQDNVIQYKSSGNFHNMNTMNFSFNDRYIVTVFEHNYLCLYRRGDSIPILEIELEGVGNTIKAYMPTEKSILLYYTEDQSLCHALDNDETVGEAIYRIALFDINSKKINILHSYSSYVNMDNDEDVLSACSPPFCMDSSGAAIVFFENNQLKKISLKTRKVMQLPFKNEVPQYITFTREFNILLLLYKDTCITYNIRENKEEKVYQYGNLTFQIKGKYCDKKLLLFDEQSNPYEWNMATETIIEKYKYSKRTVTGVYVKQKTKELIITFDNDSLWIIDGQSGILLESFNYGETDARSCLALYSGLHNCMIFLFKNYFYEYIKCYDLSTGKYKQAYFDSVDEHKIKYIFLSDTEELLFCVFEKKIIEIDIQTLCYMNVYAAKQSEIIQAAYFEPDGNTVGVVLSFVSDDANRHSGLPCVYEMRKELNGQYKCISWHRLPYLDKTLLRKLSPFYNERIESNKRFNSDYFISTGIFTEFSSELEEALYVEKHVIENGNKEQIVNVKLNPSHVNYMIGDLPALALHLDLEEITQYSVVQPIIQLLDIRKSDNTIVAYSQGNMLVYKYINGYYIKTNCISLKVIETSGKLSGAVIGQNDIIYCWGTNEQLYSFEVNSEANKQHSYYIPGLAVNGCDFTGARMSKAVRDMLVRHGGIVHNRI